MKVLECLVIISLIWILLSVVIVYFKTFSHHYSRTSPIDLVVAQQGVSRQLYPFRNSRNIQQERNEVIKSICKRSSYAHMDKIFSPIYTVDNVLSTMECDWIITEAEKHASIHGWHTKRHEYYATTDLELTEIESLSYFSLNLVYGQIIPLINEKYELVSSILGVNEVFIVKYAVGAQSYLEAHLDGGEFSFVIALNDNFTGGGTTFLPLKHGDDVTTHYSPRVGTMVLFPGQRKHIGEPLKTVGQLGYGSYYACDDMDESGDESSIESELLNSSSSSTDPLASEVQYYPGDDNEPDDDDDAYGDDGGAESILRDDAEQLGEYDGNSYT